MCKTHIFDADLGWLEIMIAAIRIRNLLKSTKSERLLVYFEANFLCAQ